MQRLEVSGAVRQRVNNASKWPMGFNSAFKGLIKTHAVTTCEGVKV